MHARRRSIIDAIIAAIIAAGLGVEPNWHCPGLGDYPVLLFRQALTKYFIGVIIPGAADPPGIGRIQFEGGNKDFFCGIGKSCQNCAYNDEIVAVTDCRVASAISEFNNFLIWFAFLFPGCVAQQLCSVPSCFRSEYR